MPTNEEEYARLLSLPPVQLKALPSSAPPPDQFSMPPAQTTRPGFFERMAAAAAGAGPAMGVPGGEEGAREFTPETRTGPLERILTAGAAGTAMGLPLGGALPGAVFGAGQQVASEMMYPEGMPTSIKETYQRPAWGPIETFAHAVAPWEVGAKLVSQAFSPDVAADDKELHPNLADLWHIILHPEEPPARTIFEKPGRALVEASGTKWYGMPGRIAGSLLEGAPGIAGAALGGAALGITGAPKGVKSLGQKGLAWAGDTPAGRWLLNTQDFIEKRAYERRLSAERETAMIARDTLLPPVMESLEGLSPENVKLAGKMTELYNPIPFREWEPGQPLPTPEITPEMMKLPETQEVLDTARALPSDERAQVLTAAGRMFKFQFQMQNLAEEKGVQITPLGDHLNVASNKKLSAVNATGIEYTDTMNGPKLPPKLKNYVQQVTDDYNREAANLSEAVKLERDSRPAGNVVEVETPSGDRAIYTPAEEEPTETRTGGKLAAQTPEATIAAIDSWIKEEEAKPAPIAPVTPAEEPAKPPGELASRRDALSGASPIASDIAVSLEDQPLEPTLEEELLGKEPPVKDTPVSSLSHDDEMKIRASLSQGKQALAETPEGEKYAIKIPDDELAERHRLEEMYKEGKVSSEDIGDAMLVKSLMDEVRKGNVEKALDIFEMLEENGQKAVARIFDLRGAKKDILTKPALIKAKLEEAIQGGRYGEGLGYAGTGERTARLASEPAPRLEDSGRAQDAGRAAVQGAGAEAGIGGAGRAETGEGAANAPAAEIGVPREEGAATGYQAPGLGVAAAQPGPAEISGLAKINLLINEAADGNAKGALDIFDTLTENDKKAIGRMFDFRDLFHKPSALIKKRLEEEIQAGRGDIMKLKRKARAASPIDYETLNRAGPGGPWGGGLGTDYEKEAWNRAGIAALEKKSWSRVGVEVPISKLLPEMGEWGATPPPPIETTEGVTDYHDLEGVGVRNVRRGFLPQVSPEAPRAPISNADARAILQNVFDRFKMAQARYSNVLKYAMPNQAAINAASAKYAAALKEYSQAETNLASVPSFVPRKATALGEQLYPGRGGAGGGGINTARTFTDPETGRPLLIGEVEKQIALSGTEASGYEPPKLPVWRKIMRTATEAVKAAKQLNPAGVAEAVTDFNKTDELFASPKEAITEYALRKMPAAIGKATLEKELTENFGIKVSDWNKAVEGWGAKTSEMGGEEMLGLKDPLDFPYLDKLTPEQFEAFTSGDQTKISKVLTPQSGPAGHVKMDLGKGWSSEETFLPAPVAARYIMRQQALINPEMMKMLGTFISPLTWALKSYNLTPGAQELWRINDFVNAFQNGKFGPETAANFTKLLAGAEDGVLKNGNITMNGKPLSIADTLRDAEIHGVTRTGYTKYEMLNAVNDSTAALKKELTLPGWKYYRNFIAASEDAMRTAVYIEYLKDGLTPEAAAHGVSEILYNYADLSPAAMASRKLGLTPFISWPMKNIPAQITFALDHPAYFAGALQARAALASGSVPEYMLSKVAKDRWNIDIDEGKDKDGNPQLWVGRNMDYPMPLYDLVPFGSSIAEGDVLELVRQMTGPMAPIYRAAEDLGEGAWTKAGAAVFGKAGRQAVKAAQEIKGGSSIADAILRHFGLPVPVDVINPREVIQKSAKSDINSLKALAGAVTKTARGVSVGINTPADLEEVKTDYLDKVEEVRSHRRDSERIYAKMLKRAP